MFRRTIKNSQGFVKSGVRPVQIQAGAMVAVTVAGEDVLLTRLDEQLIAFSGTCPHAAADLIDGTLRHNRVTCPLHGWKFDLKSGRTLWPEDESCRLPRYAIDVIDDVVWIKV